MDTTLYYDYIEALEERKVLTRKVNALRKLVTSSMVLLVQQEGKTEVCIDFKQNSEKVLELKTSSRKATFNTEFVQTMLVEYITANGQLTSANIGEFVAFADTERTKRSTPRMVLRYHKRPRSKDESVGDDDSAKPPKQLKPAPADDDVDVDFSAQV